MRSKVAAEFYDFDLDEDGNLNKSEFMAWLRREMKWGDPRSAADPMAVHRRAEFMKRQFDKADQDGNQRISLEEFAQYRENFQSALQAVQRSGFSGGFRSKSTEFET